ncbi:NAD(P)-dependent dehydrogenase, short-chain alcohol dehydrogenase family [Burkholderia sp. OK233]|nr:NAD(P)-dependent dehydrogenase, short-chain alcohol dehydrogenase family [Burkholderia sp. OK233]
MKKNLQDRSIIVTGGGSGIGRAAALMLAEAGASVIVADIDEERGKQTCRMIATESERAIFQRCDVAQEDSVAEMVDTAVRMFGKLDGAFNNAGISMSHKPLHEISSKDWNRILGADLTGVFLCMKYEIAAMLAGNGGSIVNTASVLGVVAMPLSAEYTAAKHGVIGLTKAGAVDYGSRNIRCNAITPGLIMTPIIAEALHDPGYAAHFDDIKAKHLVGRAGQPNEVAHAAKWLLSDEASFVTGHALAVDGGWTAI